MSQQSFRELGVSARVCDALAARSIRGAVHDPILRPPRCARGIRCAREVAYRVGQDPRIRDPDGGAHDQPRQAAERAGPRPTRELAVQVTEELSAIAPANGLKVAAVYGGMPLRSQADRARSANILVATPGRLQDLADRRMLDLSAVRILVLDEADRMLDMGFKPQVDRIVRLLPRNRQTMFFSATLDGEVGELARAYTSSPSRFEADLPADRAVGEIDHRFVAVSPDTKVETLVEHIRAADGLTLVFGGRSAAQTGSPRSSRFIRWTPLQCTVISLRDSASARCAVSIAARCRFSWRLTSPPAASTSTTSPT